MVLKLNEFRDKLAGCWAGKNVGGVLGAPFECKRMVPDVDFYIQDLSMGPPASSDRMAGSSGALWQKRECLHSWRLLAFLCDPKLG